jgi:hypothetical protein
VRPVAAVLLILLLCPGCDFSFSLSVASGDGLPPVSADVGSDPATDGDVRQDGLVTTAAVIDCGFDPADPPPRPEHRGFLSFPLDRIPPGAFIESATVTFSVDRVDLSAGSPDLVLFLDHVHYGETLSFAAFSAPGTLVGSLPSGVRLVPSAGAQWVAASVVPELQIDVADPFLRFFQLRATCIGGLAQIVDGEGNRAGRAPSDRSLVPELSVRFRP